MSLPDTVRLVEVGPRDGLQNEAGDVGVAARVRLIDALADAGCTHIEAGSFVSPRWVPRMAHTDQVLAAIGRPAGVRFSVLVPNMHGMQAAAASAIDEVAIFASASETFSQRNINCSIEQSLERFAPVAEAARGRSLRLRGYVSCVLGCPYEGTIAPAAVARVAASLHRLGCAEISLGDTIGVGTPLAARAMVERVAQEVPIAALALHFHDTYGQALANIAECLHTGIGVIDAAVAGLGGCPYARGASGNVASEDLIYMLHGMGLPTGVDLDRLIAAGRAICAELGRASGSRVSLAKGR